MELSEPFSYLFLMQSFLSLNLIIMSSSSVNHFFIRSFRANIQKGVIAQPLHHLLSSLQQDRRRSIYIDAERDQHNTTHVGT